MAILQGERIEQTLQGGLSWLPTGPEDLGNGRRDVIPVRNRGELHQPDAVAGPFLGAVSAGLIALGFDSTRGASPTGHMIFQVLVLTPLVFLGLVAFVRCLEIAIDDWEFATRITRLRRTYDHLVPELAPLMSQAVADEGVAAMLSPRWQPFQKMLSVAGSVAVITSVVLGGDAGVIVYGVSRLLYVAVAGGVAAGALALGWATWYQWRHWCQASPPSSRELTPGLAARAA